MPSDLTTFTLGFGILAAGIGLYALRLRRMRLRLAARLAALRRPRAPPYPADPEARTRMVIASTSLDAVDAQARTDAASQPPGHAGGTR